jgi:hypothetical protein
VLVQGSTSRPLYLRGNSLRYPLDRKLREPQSWSRRYGKKEILPSRDSKPRPLADKPIESGCTNCATLSIKNNLYA